MSWEEDLAVTSSLVERLRLLLETGGESSDDSEVGLLCL